MYVSPYKLSDLRDVVVRRLRFRLGSRRRVFFESCRLLLIERQGVVIIGRIDKLGLKVIIIKHLKQVVLVRKVMAMALQLSQLQGTYPLITTRHK